MLEGVLTVEMSLRVFEMPFSVFLFVEVLTSERCVVCCLLCVVCFLCVVFLCCVHPICSASILSPGALLLLAVFIFFLLFFVIFLFLLSDGALLLVKAILRGMFYFECVILSLAFRCRLHVLAACIGCMC